MTQNITKRKRLTKEISHLRKNPNVDQCGWHLTQMGKKNILYLRKPVYGRTAHQVLNFRWPLHGYPMTPPVY